MKKALIITVITSTILFFLGGILFTIGIVTGGRASFNIDFNNNKVLTDKNIKMITKEESLSDFKNIKIDADAYNVTIKKGDSFSVNYGAYENAMPEIKVEGDTLNILSKHEKIQLNLLSFSDDIQVPYIIITVPETTDLSECTMKLNAGEINISNQNFEDIDLDTDAGNIILSDITTNGFKILASAGNVNISDSTISDLDVQSNAGNIVFDEIESDQIKLDIDYGNLEISDSQVKKISVDADAGKIDINDIQSDDITIDADYGSTDLKMIGNEDDYDIEVEVDYGDFSLNGKDQNNKYKANNDKEKKIKINSDAGDVNIRFE